MDEQQQILAMILDAKAAGKNEDEIVEMLREARDAQLRQDNPILESVPEPTDSQQYGEIYEEIEEIDEKYDEIEWIFPDDEVDVQNEQLIETSPVSMVSNTKEHSTKWENRIHTQLTVDTSLESAMDSPSGLAIVKTSQLENRPLSQPIAPKRNSQSPLSILGAFVFLGAVIGVTLYQFFRLQPKPPNISAEAMNESSILIASDSPTASPNDTPLPPGCGAFSGTREAHITELKTSKAVLEELFPTECQVQLDDLQFRYAIEKLAANDSDFLAATIMICEVTDTYFKQDDDPFRRHFFRDWSENNNNYKAWLEKYLTVRDCPAANYLQ